MKEEGKKIIGCPDQREPCASSSFKSVQDLRYHLQDTHCIPMFARRTRTDACGRVKEETVQVRAAKKRQAPTDEDLHDSQRSSRSSAKRVGRDFSVLTPESFTNGHTVLPRKRRRVGGAGDPTPPTAHTPCETHTVRCPACLCEVEEDFFNARLPGLRHPSVREQVNFCRAHRRETVKHEWSRRGFPSINWEDLDQRLTQFHFRLNQILNSKLRPFYQRKVKNEMRNNPRRFVGSYSPLHHAGYYGPRGDEML